MNLVNFIFGLVFKWPCFTGLLYVVIPLIASLNHLNLLPSQPNSRQLVYHYRGIAPADSPVNTSVNFRIYKSSFVPFQIYFNANVICQMTSLMPSGTFIPNSFPFLNLAHILRAFHTLPISLSDDRSSNLSRFLPSYFVSTLQLTCSFWLFFQFQKVVMNHYLMYLSNEVDSLKYPIGTRQHPATTCSEILDNLDDPADGNVHYSPQTPLWSPFSIQPSIFPLYLSSKASIFRFSGN